MQSGTGAGVGAPHPAIVCNMFQSLFHHEYAKALHKYWAELESKPGMNGLRASNTTMSCAEAMPELHGNKSTYFCVCLCERVRHT